MKLDCVMQKFKKNWLVVWKMKNLKNMKNLENFHQITRKYQNQDSHRSFYTKQEMYELKIYRGDMRYDNEK